MNTYLNSMTLPKPISQTSPTRPPAYGGFGDTVFLSVIIATAVLPCIRYLPTFPNPNLSQPYFNGKSSPVSASPSSSIMTRWLPETMLDPEHQLRRARIGAFLKIHSENPAFRAASALRLYFATVWKMTWSRFLRCLGVFSAIEA